MVTRVQTIAARIKADNTLGLPFFNPVKLVPDEVSDPHQWNKQLREILWDLTTLFNEAKSQGQRLMALSMYYNHERDRLDRMIKELNLKCTVLEDRLELPNTRGFTDSFTDFNTIETGGDIERGLALTTAMVDLKRGSVRLPRLPGIPAKYDLKNAYIRVDGSVEQFGKIENIISDSIDKTWQATSGQNTLSISVELEQEVEVNCIELEYENVGNPEVTISIGQGANVINLGDFIAWEFEPQVIKNFTITITKQVPDVDDKYIYAIKHLAVKMERYQNKAVMITKRFPLNQVNEITLKTEEIVPAQTNIRYYLSLEYKNRPFDWFEITKDRPVVFNNVEEEFGIFDSGDAFFGTEVAEEFGVKYYAIGSIERLPFANSINLNMGERMWLVESIALPPAAFTEDQPNPKFTPSIADWKLVTKPDKAMVDTERISIPLFEGKLYKLTTYINCITESMPPSVTPEITNGGSFSLYINSTRIQPVSGKFPLKFKQGWNKIEFYVAVYNPGTEFKHKLPLDILSDTIFADSQPMQLVSMHELTCNTSLDNNSRFALLKKDDIYLVVVNFNPVTLDMYKQGCRFAYEYKYLDTDDELEGFRMMARFERSKLAKEVTCHLLGYRLLTK